MSTTKTTTQRIDTLQERIQQLENQKKLLLQKQKTDERKARTKRLIERGAILESLISGADKFTNEQIKTFLEKTVTTENVRKFLDGFTAQDETTAAVKAPWKAIADSTAAAEKATVTERGGG